MTMIQPKRLNASGYLHASATTIMAVAGISRMVISAQLMIVVLPAFFKIDRAFSGSISIRKPTARMNTPKSRTIHFASAGIINSFSLLNEGVQETAGSSSRDTAVV